MEFDQALQRLDEQFGPRSDFPDGDKGIIVVSGGVVESEQDNVPALALTKGLAVGYWLDAAKRALSAIGPALKTWRVGDMHLDTWNMTLADRMNQHRVAEKRYSAQARIFVMLKTQAEIDAEMADLLEPTAPPVSGDFVSYEDVDKALDLTPADAQMGESVPLKEAS